MINLSAIGLLQTRIGNGITQNEIDQLFNNPNVYVIEGTKGRSIEPLAIGTRSFTDYKALEAAFNNGSIDSSVGAIIYDNEDWGLTPLDQQQHPAEFEQTAAQIVHQHHLIFIATPATNLVTVADPSAVNGSKFDRFIADGYAGDAARYADVYEIQSQGSEGNIAEFRTFVSEAAAQARKANPAVVILAGLSTNPQGQAVTGDQLYAAVQATRASVSGYWLNIPAGGTYCPKCGTPQPQVAVSLLDELLDAQK